MNNPEISQEDVSQGNPVLLSVVYLRQDMNNSQTFSDRDFNPIPTHCKQSKQNSISEDTTCGIGCLRGPWIQPLANAYNFAICNGILMCIATAIMSYFSGTISTIEKRFEISSEISGILSIGNCIVPVFATVILSYYAGRSRIPRWIATATYSTVILCGLMILPHLLYGPGKHTLLWTEEHGKNLLKHENLTVSSARMENNSLCLSRDNKNTECDDKTDVENLLPQIIIFFGQFISGIGSCIYHHMGYVYLDDNYVSSSFIGLTGFLETMGSTLGYGLAAYCLKIYVDPSLTPTITNSDTRWIGAWWMGWIILAVLMFISASIVGLFPKTLPKAAARRALNHVELHPNNYPPERNDFQPKDEKVVRNTKQNEESSSPRGSIADMMTILKNLLRNKALVCRHTSRLCTVISVLAYWTFLPKYMEIQYQQSAAASSFFTGLIVVSCTAVGHLLPGFVISKLKLMVKHAIHWTIVIKIISTLCMVSLVFIGCTASDNQIKEIGDLAASSSCIEGCSCEFATYEPVCYDNVEQFVSPCHAGCRSSQMNEDGTKMYSNCRCLSSPSMNSTGGSVVRTVVSGSCPVDCSNIFYVFLALVCVVQFNFGNSVTLQNIVSMRSVTPKEKSVVMSSGLMLVVAFAYIPGPLLYGFIIDRSCILWGRTCSGSFGNCWVYDTKYLRYLLNLTAAGFATLGALFEAAIILVIKNQVIYTSRIRVKNGPSFPEQTKL